MSSLTPLSKLLPTLEGSSKALAFNDTQQFTAGDFYRDCQAICTKIKQRKESEAILCCHDSYLFAAAFLALLHCGKKICMPPNANPGVIAEMLSGRILVDDEFLHNLPDDHAVIEPIVDATKCQISLFTSGSTGDCQEVRKNLPQLEAEVEVLHETWEVSGHAIATVSHQHIYGLLFKILWPLSTGRPFHTGTVLFEHDLARLFQKHSDSLLISCPAHLDAFCRFKDTEFIEKRIVFSSGAPLSSTTAAEFKNINGLSPIEVFGSTETGGIAWRRQTENADWQILNRIKIKAVDKILWVKSPFTECANEWYETSDSAQIMSSSSFKHLGRTDRVVKVSGKRLSLGEMEKRLVNDPLIQSARITVLNEKGLSSRQSAAAVCCLTPEGLKVLKEGDKKALTTLFKKELSEFFEPVVLPRFWRFVESFPHDSQGKTNGKLLKLLFTGFDEKEKRYPDIRALSFSPERIYATIIVPPNLAFFDGHFDQQPILAGVAQVFWITWLAEELFECEGVSEVAKLKFNKMIFPEKTLTIEIIKKKNSIEFSFKDHENAYSSGILKYGK